MFLTCATAARGVEAPSRLSPVISRAAPAALKHAILPVVGDPRSLHQASPAELKRRLDAGRAGTAYLLYREPGAGERILPLPESAAVIGRDAACDAPLTWDEQVSRLHVELANLRGHWLVIDDGLSRNGTFVNGERVVGRRRLHNGDLLLVGSTSLLFCEARDGDRQSTAVPESAAGRVDVSPAQHRVLVALCRPVQGVDRFDSPATNQQIADELYLTVAAVKTHLRALSQRLGLTGVPQNAKRARLVQMAFELELVGPTDFLEAS